EYRRIRGGRTVAVDGLDLEVPDGGVFGFLGPNGAGKTTTIRCVLGLVRPNAGSLMLLGADVSGGLASVIGKVGSIVEQPALFPEGGTVFVSSDILSEVQQTADQVAIIARGRLVKAGPVNEVLAAGRARGLVVRLADLPAGARVLADAQIPAVVAGDTLSVELPRAQAERVTRVLAAKDLYVSELRPQEVDLETVFLELTKDEGLGP